MGHVGHFDKCWNCGKKIWPGCHGCMWADVGQAQPHGKQLLSCRHPHAFPGAIDALPIFAPAEAA